MLVVNHHLSDHIHDILDWSFFMGILIEVDFRLNNPCAYNNVFDIAINLFLGVASRLFWIESIICAHSHVHYDLFALSTSDISLQYASIF